MIHLDFKKYGNGNHHPAHIVGPLEDLWADVNKECVGGPASKDYNVCGRDVVDEQSHCGTRSN
jgi:hypothetical protein